MKLDLQQDLALAEAHAANSFMAAVSAVRALLTIAEQLAEMNPYERLDADGVPICLWCGAFDYERHGAQCLWKSARELTTTTSTS